MKFTSSSKQSIIGVNHKNQYDNLNLKTAQTSLPDTVYNLGFQSNSKKVKKEQAVEVITELINLIRMEEYIHLNNIVDKGKYVKYLAEGVNVLTDTTTGLLNALLPERRR
jgi:hypothetical protein